SRYVETTWPASGGEHQSFLANSFDEAVSGAIKLARFACAAEGASPRGLILDPAGRLGPFASAAVGEERIEFVPGLVDDGGPDLPYPDPFGFVVLVAAGGSDLERWAEMVQTAEHHEGALVITCVDRPALAALRQSKGGLLRKLTPSIVVFDESFAGHD